MGKNSILTLFDKLKIGDDGEKEVLSDISKMLKSSKNSDNFLLIPKAQYRDWETDRKSTRLNSSHSGESRMPSSA